MIPLNLDEKSAEIIIHVLANSLDHFMKEAITHKDSYENYVKRNKELESKLAFVDVRIIELVQLMEENYEKYKPTSLTRKRIGKIHNFVVNMKARIDSFGLPGFDSTV